MSFWDQLRSVFVAQANQRLYVAIPNDRVSPAIPDEIFTPDDCYIRAHCLTEESYFERRGCLMENLTLLSFSRAVDSWDMGH
jgi:hypothetical protein